MNSNKKLLSVLLAAVLLVGCIVGMLIVGANAAGETTWTVGASGDYTTLDDALAAIEGTTWSEGDSLKIQLEAGAYTATTAANEPLFLGLPTIWTDAAKTKKLPITIEGAGSATTSIAIHVPTDTGDSYHNNKLAFANDFTFDKVTFQPSSAVTLSAGSGNTVFKDDAKITASFYVGNYTQAAFDNWNELKVDTAKNIVKTSIKVGAGVTNSGTFLMDKNFNGQSFRAATFAGYNGGEKVYSTQLDVALYIENNTTFANGRIAGSSNNRNYNAAITLDYGKGSTFSDVRGGGAAAVIMGEVTVNVHDGAKMVGDKRLWLLDYSDDYYKNLNLNLSGSETYCNVGIGKGRGAGKIRQNLNVNLSDGFHIDQIKTDAGVNELAPNILGPFTVLGNVNLTMDNVTWTNSFRVMSGDKSYLSSCKGANITIKNCNNTDGVFYLVDAYFASTGLIGENGLTLKVENSTLASMTLLRNGAKNNGKFDLDLINSDIQGDIVCNYLSAQSLGAFDIYVEDTKTQDITLCYTKANDQTGCIMGATDGNNKIEFVGDSVMTQALYLSYHAKDDKIMNQVLGNIDIVIGGNTEFTTSDGDNDLCHNGYFDGNLSVTLKDNASIAGNFSLWRYAVGIKNVTTLLKDNATIAGNFAGAGRIQYPANGDITTTIEGNVTIGGNVYMAGTGSDGYDADPADEDTTLKYTVTNIVRPDANGDVPTFNGTYYGIGTGSYVYGNGVATITNTISGGNFNGETSAYLASSATRGVLSGTVTTTITGGNFAADIYNSSETNVKADAITCKLSIQPTTADIYFGGVVRNAKGTDKSSNKYSIDYANGDYALKIGSDSYLCNINAFADNKITITMTGDWIDRATKGNAYVVGPMGTEYTVVEEDSVSNKGFYYFGEENKSWRIFGGYEPQEIFYGLQLDMSGNQIKFYAYLYKDAVETLAARYGDEFIVEYALGQKGGAFALANLVLDGEYYVADLGYLSASEFVAAYSFTSKDAVAKTGILLDFIGGHALNEENEAEMQALCAALYTYGYQAAAEFGTLDEYANEAYAALQTRADAADLLAAYEIYAGEQYHKATSTEGFKMAGMTTLLGNQIAINVYVETEVTGDVVIDIAGQKYNATLADAEIGGVAYKYFTIAPNVEHMAAIISMTISQGEAELGTATVSIPGYAAAMVTADAENAELYYAILGYIAAVEELPPEWLA